MKLSDKYTRTSGSAYMTGIQALVRLPLDQMRRDRAAQLNTGCFISGYEGSPLGGYDLALARERKLLAELGIHHWPAVNEDLGATAIFGSQIAPVMGPTKVDGVVGIWYGKGPGVDRSGDIFRHANLAGSPGLSATLVLAGDDPTSKSSTIPHQSDFSLMNWGLPVLMPGNTQEVLDLGLYGIALSRYTGLWTGLKLVTNVCDGGGTVNLDPARLAIIEPDSGYTKKMSPVLLMPHSLESEAQLNGPRTEAALAFIRANQLNSIVADPAGARIGIATAGKPYYDLRQALSDLGLAESPARIAKFGATYPLDHQFARDFARGLDLILVIEEKRSFLETHLREALYPLADRPQIIGKRDLDGQPLLPASGELDPDFLAVALARVLDLPRRVLSLPTIAASAKSATPGRMPNFCSGCPHNRSTISLEGQVVGGGTGCHGMGILMMDSGRGYQYCTHMGGEGAPWIGMAPFSERQHIFHNLGDGTYFHSGSLAVQACVASGVNITFKILYNSHVAMTGGQLATGALAVPELTRKLEADGVRKIIVLVEDVEKYSPLRHRFAANAEIRDRFELEPTLRELEQESGVTVMLYDQECAAEKRRARSRGKQEEPTLRLLINEEVCEGCGDCVKQSNCMSLQPVDTPLGQKMRIHQSSCNKDYTCALGDCPSFVTVKIKEGTGLKKRPLPVLPATAVADPPTIATLGPRGYRIVMPGIGGTGVITISALLATAATIDGLHVQTLDQTGLAQKGGAVVSHLHLSRTPILAAAQTNSANADLLFGCDLLGVIAPSNLKTAHPERTVAVVNTTVTPTSFSIRQRLPILGPESQLVQLNAATHAAGNVFVDATRIAESLFGSHLAVNVFLLGVAYQAGRIPISRAALEEAIRLNGVDAERNLAAFLWGRQWIEDPAKVESLLAPAPEAAPAEFDRFAELTAYQNRAYALEWQRFVEAQPAELRDVVARYLYKLMAYKDEYEVARLMTKPRFLDEIRATFAEVEWHGFNLLPPVLRSLGSTRKLKLGPWMITPLALLAKLKFLRGTLLDLFGHARHRREERDAIRWYRQLVADVARQLSPEKTAAARELLALPDQIRGYDEIKSRSLREVQTRAAEALSRLTQKETVRA